MIGNKRSLFFYVTFGCFINLCSTQQSLRNIDECTQWNASEKKILFDDLNPNNTQNDYSLNLLDSNLDINRETGEIAVLDDRNHRVFIFDPSNTSVLLAVFSDSSSLTNKSAIPNSPSAITFGRNNSFFVLDYNGTEKQLIEINMKLRYGANATTITTSTINGTLRGLARDQNDGAYTSCTDRNHILYWTPLYTPSEYLGNSTAGNSSSQLNNPQSIVMDINQTLYVNDFGNNRIQMFKNGSKIGITLPINISGCRGLSLYNSNVLLLNTNWRVYLFNLTNNFSRCILGCSETNQFKNISNAILDNNGSLVITHSNQILSFPPYELCLQTSSPNRTVQLTSSGAFVPNQNCSTGKYGINCSFDDDVCNLNQPCLNSGSCIVNKTNDRGYTCECSWGFNGTRCENDNRPCQFFTCFLRGDCVNTSMTEYNCSCLPGYEGKRCEITINYCANVTCQNRAICSQQYLNYTCNCLEGFSGRHCEITETSAVIRGYVVKSLGYIAIIMISSIIGFFVFMDVLKYVFGIDPIEADRKALREKRYRDKLKKKKLQKKQTKQQPRVAYRFRYVN